MKPLEITESREPLAESNCYILAAGDRCVVIDPNEEKIAAVLRDRRLRPEWIFLTHEHCDHIAGLNALRAAFPTAKLLAGERCGEGIQNSRQNMSAIMEVYLTFRGKPGIPYAPFVCAPADVTFQDEYQMNWRGQGVRFVSLPGHSSGSTGIFLNNDAFFSGDYLIPGEDVILRLPGGSEREYLEKTEPFLRSLPEGITIYPGHGEHFLWNLNS